MHAVIGGSRDESWHVLGYAEGLHYCRVWWQRKADEIMRHDQSIRCMGDGKAPARIVEIVALGAEDESRLV